jgi:hypothetical protein
MFVAPPEPGPEPTAESTLLYGRGETPLLMLAVGLAQRVHPEFAWANCSETSAPGSDEVVARLTRAHRLEPHDGPIAPAELERPEVHEAAFTALIASRLYRVPLLPLLRLPSLLQGVVPFPPARGEHPALVLARIDALPASVRTETLESAEVHATLRASGVSLLATYRGSAPTTLQRAFDRVYGIEEAPSLRWADALVWGERGRADVELVPPQPLRELWRQLGLEKELLTR